MSAEPGDLRFDVLGPLRVWGPDGERPISGPRQLALLAVLLLEGGRPVSRERLIDELWADDPPRTAVNALQVHVAGLRRALGAGIRTSGAAYALEAGPGSVDAGRFEALAGEAGRVADPKRRSALLAEALGLWRGPAFANVPRTAAIAAAAGRLEERRLGAVEDRVEADLACGRHEALVPELRELVANHPERERLAGQLMLALHRSDRSADALDAYRDLAAALDRRLGVDPSDALAALERAIRRADPTLAAPPAASLPAPASRFVGRRRELAETAALLGRTRLLTLVGPGGSGKTRLAIELAARALADHPDGVQFVDLAPLDPADSVAHATAAALHVQARTGGPAGDALAAQLRDRRLLLVLDNCEHVAGAAGELVRELLAACAGLRVLATSRQQLGLAGETVWQVPGLALPPPDAGSAAAAGSDAVRLLIDRASSALPGYAPGGDHALLAAAVCRRLDALPLAIELVAGRLPALSLDEVAAHLDRRLALLAAAGAAAGGRHRTMRAAIEWSHELLEAEERVLFRRLGVFAGAFGLGAAEAVAANPSGPSPREPAAVLPVLLRLVEKSMVVAERFDAGTRYRLLETVREYALGRLDEAGEADAARDRHARWYGQLAESANSAAGAARIALTEQLDAELANVRSALGWCLGEGQAPERALAIAAPLWWYWWLTGASDEGQAWLLRCLDAVDPAPTTARALGLRTAAALARNCGDDAEALRLGEECLAAYRALDDALGVAAALNGLSITAAHMGDDETALRHAVASLEGARAAGSRHGEASSLINLAWCARSLGRLDEARDALTDALAAFRELGNRRGEAAALSGLAMVARRDGEPRLARRLALEGLATYQAIGLREGEMDTLVTLAALDVAEGRPERALLVISVVDRERDRLRVAVPSAEEARDRDATLAAALAALDEPHQAAVLGEAERTGLDAIVAELLAAGEAGVSRSR